MAESDKEAPYIPEKVPVKLGLDDRFRFRCHKDIACFNVCCHQIDLPLTPYDILRLKNRLGMTAIEFIKEYGLPYEMDAHGMPGIKMRPLPNSTSCPFVTEEGCSVYEDRPVACRYYALGRGSMRPVGEARIEDYYFIVKEDHCLGHQKGEELTIREYREQQGIPKFDEMNEGWRDIIIKKRSSGPTVGKPPESSMRLFFMASYDMEGFLAFLVSDGFRAIYDLDREELETLVKDEEARMRFAWRFLKQVLFGEMTIPVREDAKQAYEALLRERARAMEEERRSFERVEGAFDVPLPE